MNNHNYKVILVSGTNSVLIELDAEPKEVSVEFKKQHHRHRKHHNVPCNPHQDTLDYCVVSDDELFFLKIEWCVSNVREVLWAVKY
jgi:hypothetical protein